MNETNTNQDEPHRTSRTKIVLIVLSLVLVSGAVWVLAVGLPWFHGVQAYIYGYSLVMMDVTREVSTAVSEPGYVKAPMNQFAVMDHYPDVNFRLIPRTGLDTLFAVAWADLDEEPIVLSVPDTDDRYYVIALFDHWSNVFASIGKRTTGTKAEDYMIAGPGWKGSAPRGVQTIYHSPTRYVWVNAQMRADGTSECAAVTALQKQYKLTPLSKWGQVYEPPTNVPVDPSVNTASALDQISKMDAETYFTRLTRLMKDNPPSEADALMVKKLIKLGIVPGLDLDYQVLSKRQKKNLDRAMSGQALLIKGIQKLPMEKGWAKLSPDIANYGTDYLTRAALAMIGLGAVWPKDVSYPVCFGDEDNKPLDAAHNYVLHFDKEQIPPARETWSVSIYDPQGFYVPNALDRYNLAAWMPLQYNPDGSLDLYIQTTSPGADRESNWLPAPASGPLNLVIRIFWPEEDYLNGTWKAPGIKIVK